MTEYELVELFLTYGEFLQSIVERFITLLFAFLIASYLVSQKLQWTIVVIVLGLYSYMALQYAFFYFGVAGDQIALAAQLRELRAVRSSSLEWLDISPALATVYRAQTIAMVVSYVASIFFFFHTRRRGMLQGDVPNSV